MLLQLQTRLATAGVAADSAGKSKTPLPLFSSPTAASTRCNATGYSENCVLLELRREAENVHDTCAVAVYLSKSATVGQHLGCGPDDNCVIRNTANECPQSESGRMGYIPAVLAAVISPLMDAGIVTIAAAHMHSGSASSAPLQGQTGAALCLQIQLHKDKVPFISDDNDSTFRQIEQRLQETCRLSLMHHSVLSTSHFIDVLQLAAERQKHLLLPSDYEHYHNFCSLPRATQRAYVKLLCRKRNWLKASSVHVDSLDEPGESASANGSPHQAVINHLSAVSLIEVSWDEQQQSKTTETSSATTAQLLTSLLECCTTAELNALCNKLKLTRSGGREVLFSRIQKHLFGQRRLDGSLAGASPAMKRLLLGTIEKRIRVADDSRRSLLRMYALQVLSFNDYDTISGSTEKEEALDADFHIHVDISARARQSFPPYVLSPSIHVVDHQPAVYGPFCSRRQMLNYEAALEISIRIEQAETRGDLAEVIGGIATSARALLQRMQQPLVEDQQHIIDLTNEDAAPNDQCMKIDANYVPSCWKRFSCITILARIFQHVMTALEKLQMHEEAVALQFWLLDEVPEFQRTRRRGYWWSRLALNLEVHLSDKVAALQIIQRALGDESVGMSSRLALTDRARRLVQGNSKRNAGVSEEDAKSINLADRLRVHYLSIEITGRRTNRAMGQKSRFIGYDGDSCSVEQLVMQHMAQLELYAAQHVLRDDEVKENPIPETLEIDADSTGAPGTWRGFHDEGGFMRHLFSVLLWDAIWLSPLPEVFLSPYQSAPLDFGSKQFADRRTPTIDRICDEISNGLAVQIVERIYALHAGRQCIGIQWEKYCKRTVLEVLDCIPTAPLISFLRKRSGGEGHGGGYPDLTMYRTDAAEGSGEHCCRFMLVEVKGPSDRLFEEQEVVLDMLHQCGFITAVCKVKEPNKNMSGKKRSLPSDEHQDDAILSSATDTDK